MKCWLHMTSGRGPEECKLGLRNLWQAIEEEATEQGYSLTLLDNAPDWGSVVASVDAPQPWLATLEGTIQWTCPSPIRPNHRRKNWFVGVILFPEVEEADIAPELRFEYYQASGPGGQHRNRTRSAVRLTCDATGIIVTAEEERSQTSNRKLALARYTKQRQLAEEGRAAEVREKLWVDHLQLERGNPVRVYKGPRFRRHR